FKHYQHRACEYAKKFLWRNVGKKYIDLFNQLSTTPPPNYTIAELTESDKVFPELNLNHLFNLTDDTGILQHARYHITDRNHGYCLDDNARALLLATLLKKKLGDHIEINSLFNTYLSFVDYAYNRELNRFRNFMGYDRRWLEESGSEDSQGRTVWALGEVLSSTYNSNILEHVENLFYQ